MKVETLIYIYMIICVSLMVFNSAYIFVMRRMSTTIDKNSDIYLAEITEQLDLIKNGQNINAKHRKKLYKKLKKTQYLTAFDKSLEILYAERYEDVKKYILEIYPVIMYLAEEYKKKDTIQAAYLPYIISKYDLMRSDKLDFIADTMLELLRAKNVYSRENALRAIYSMGNADFVIKALSIIDSEDIFHHPKLITDGFFKFCGDKNELATVLWKNLSKFSEKMQVNILNYLRFSGARNDDKMLEIIADEKAGREMRFSAIRYFEKFPNPSALPILHDFAAETDGAKWEYQAIASTALHSYPGYDTEEILKKNLSNPNWYVRFNSAESCERLGLTYSDLINVFNGDDKYARDMLKYRFDRKSAMKEEVGV